MAPRAIRLALTIGCHPRPVSWRIIITPWADRDSNLRSISNSYPSTDFISWKKTHCKNTDISESCTYHSVQCTYNPCCQLFPWKGFTSYPVPECVEVEFSCEMCRCDPLAQRWLSAEIQCWSCPLWWYGAWWSRACSKGCVCVSVCLHLISSFHAAARR